MYPKQMFFVIALKDGKNLSCFEKCEFSQLSDDTFQVSIADATLLPELFCHSNVRNVKDEDGNVVNHAQYKGRIQSKVLPADVKDLSEYSEPIGDLFGPMSSWEQSALRLSDEQVAHFWEKGYVSNVKVLSEEQCDKLLQEYTLFMDPENRHPGHALFYEFHDNQTGDINAALLHALGQWRITPCFHDLVFLPQIAVPASQLLQQGKECAVRFWHDQLFAKPPNAGGNVAWHQDYSYWTRTVPLQHLTVHIALDAQGEENGGLQFIPSSHHWHRNGQPLPITDADFADMESIKKVLTAEELSGFQPVFANLKKGEASFHHGLTVHGSGRNSSKNPRRAAVVNYFADGTKSASEDVMLDGVPTIPPGEKMQGRFFPVVYDPTTTK